MNIYESISSIMQESIAIGKEKYNEQQKFKYRGIDDVMNTFYPLLSKYKVFIVPEVLEQSREERQSKSGGNLIYSILKIKYSFFAEDGTSVTSTVIGEGMDIADKASNKAMAVAMKYAMFQVFCIPTEEMPDPDATTPPPSTPKPKTEKKTEPKKNDEPIRKLTADEIDEIANGKDSCAIELAQAKLLTTSGGKSYDSLKDDQLQFIMQKSSNAKSRTAAAEIWLERHLDDGTIPTDEPQDLPF